jgi:hypothetical protein
MFMVLLFCTALWLFIIWADTHWRAVFDARAVIIGFVVDRVALGQFFLYCFGFLC